MAELAGKTQACDVHDPLDKQVSDSDVTLTSFVTPAKHGKPTVSTFMLKMMDAQRYDYGQCKATRRRQAKEGTKGTREIEREVAQPGS